MQTYDEMVDSGIDWLGTIPSEWQKKRAKFIFRKVQDPPLDEDEVVTAFRDGEVVLRSLRREDGFTFANKEIGYQHVSKGDLVIHAMDAFAGAIGVSKSDGKMSPVCSICKPVADNTSNKYYSYLLRAMTRTNYLVAIAKGIRERSTDFRYSDFGNMVLPLPSPAQQQKIADFLDAETAKIDNLIAKQERLLELLEEKRRATITHAVTRGLNPNAELKETNIPWLGQIPAHWELYRAKYLFEKAQEKPYDTDEVVTAFRDGEVVLRKLRREEGFTFADKEIGYQHVRVGDLVIHAMDAFAGAVGVSKSEGKMSPVCSICRPIRPDVSTEYFAQLVRAMTSTNYLVAIAKGIRERSTDFRFGDFSNMTFPLPPIEEQKNIVSKINSENEKVAVLKKKIQTQIKLLKERRTSLISHAVTGKIKV